jgi:RNA-binding protein NOB1
MLKTLPVELKIREPLPEDIAYTKQFAKVTGDLGFLSTNDLDLIALTVRLEREAGGKLRDRPAGLDHSSEACSLPYDWAPEKAKKPSDLPCEADAEDGWAVAGTGRRGKKSFSASQDAQAHQSQGQDRTESKEGRGSNAGDDATQAQESPGLRHQEDRSAAEEEKPVEATDNDCRDEQAEGENEGENEEEFSEDGDSAGEWVTEENMHRFGVGVQLEEHVKVTCATADYSVQNVLLQMGITPLTFDGYAVKSVKMWGLICRACFYFHRDSQLVFCPKCGNDTVVRVPIVVKDGVPTVLNSGRKLRTKGQVFSMPKPQGGRAWKPIMSEDEIKIGGRDREFRHLEKVFEKERQLRDPFNVDNGARSWHQRSTTSSGKMITTSGGGPRIQAGYGRRLNPNAGNFKGFKPKKR